MKTSKLILGAALAVLGSVATAAGTGNLYAGGSFGITDADIDCEGTTSCDNSDTGFKIYGGYKLSKELSVEVGYFNFGKPRATVPVAGIPPVDADLETTAFTAGVAYRASIATDWNLILRGGLALVSTEASARVGSFSGNDSENTAKLYVGLGVGYAITPQLTVEGSWDFTQGEIEGESFRVDLLSIGLNYAF